MSTLGNFSMMTLVPRRVRCLASPVETGMVRAALPSMRTMSRCPATSTVLMTLRPILNGTFWSCWP